MPGITLAGAGRGAAPFVQRNIWLCKARENPGRLNYSTGGYGSPHYLATITLFHHAGLPRNIAAHVPFCRAPALMALGNAQFMITSRTSRAACNSTRGVGIAACIQRHRDERGNLALPAQSLRRTRRNLTPR
jgi:Tripartite tricarboxylate transporter family receptor